MSNNVKALLSSNNLIEIRKCNFFQCIYITKHLNKTHQLLIVFYNQSFIKGVNKLCFRLSIYFLFFYTSSSLRPRQHQNQANQSPLQLSQTQSRLSNISTKIKGALRGGPVDGNQLSHLVLCIIYCTSFVWFVSFISIFLLKDYFIIFCVLIRFIS